MKSKLDKFEYTEYIDYLVKRGIKFSQEKYVDDCLACEEVLEVTPYSKQLKSRMFSTDGGWQMFDGVDYWKLL